ncbi:MAG: DUF2232 domain-containing protein [Erysipelotrichaceae bacterium]|nr:DUF2232 domain-containing protein [Erysipelotrichaceae bacterium]
MNKTKKLTQGAMLLAIVGAVMLIDRQIGFIFEYFIFMVAPVVVVIYTVMYTLQDGGILCFGLLVLGILFGSTSAYVYMPLSIIVGLGLGIAIKKDLNRNLLMLVTMVLYIIGEVVITFVVFPILGIDLAAQISELNTALTEYGMMEQLSLISGNVSTLLAVIYVASVIITGALEGFFTYFVSIVLLKRLRIKDIGISNALDLKMSPAMAYVLFIMSIGMFVLGRVPAMLEKHEMLYYILICISFMATIVLFYYGYIYATIYLRLFMGKKSVILLILFIIFLFPASYIILMVTGFLYGAGPLRRKLEERMSMVNNNEKKQ